MKSHYPNAKFDLRRLEAGLFINNADFGRAVTALEAIMASGVESSSLLNNLALCHENLGNLNKAKRIQLEAQAVARKTGYFPVEILSVANLGSIETKLGNLTEG